MSNLQSSLECEALSQTVDIEKTSILFVCMGNICRSPTAEGVMRKMLLEAGLQDFVTVDSCGTHDYRVGKAPDPRAQAAAVRRGYDLSDLCARQIESRDFERFDLLLAMDYNNLALLQSMCPFMHRHKVRLLMDYAYRLKASVVPDPFEGRHADFETVLDYIEDACTGITKILTQTIHIPL